MKNDFTWAVLIATFLVVSLGVDPMALVATGFTGLLIALLVRNEGVKKA